MAAKNSKGFDREAALMQIMGEVPARDIHDRPGRAPAEAEDVSTPAETAARVKENDRRGAVKKAGGDKASKADDLAIKVKRCYYLSPKVIEALRKKCFESPDLSASGHVEEALIRYLEIE